MAAALVTLEKSAKGGMQKFFKYVPAVVLCYLIAMLLCTLGVWDMAETKPAYSALKNNLTYAMIFAMLLRCNIRKVLKLGPKMLIGFFSATLTIMIGFVCAFVLMKGTIGSDVWMGLCALCGSWIGGSGNMVAMQAALDISEADMGYALVIDSIDYSLWIMFLLRVIQLAPKFNKWTKADTSKLDEVSSRLEEEAKLNTKPITFHDMTDDLVYREVQLTGVSGRKIWETWEDFAKVMKGPYFKLDQVIGGRFPMKDFEAALAQIHSGVPGKMILYP